MSGVRVRAYADDDREAIVELRRAVAAVDRTDDGLVVAEPPPDSLFSGHTQHEDIFVVRHDGGRILATAQLQAEIGPQQSFVWAFPVVHPEWRGPRIEKLLIDRLRERASERRRAIRSEVVHFYVHCGAHQEKRIALYESSGLRFMRHRPHMIYHPLERVAPPQAPPGITLRPCLRGLDDESAIRTLIEAFADDWEYVPVTGDGWSRSLDAPQWREDLNLVAAVWGGSSRPLPLCGQRRAFAVAEPQRRIRGHALRAAIVSARGNGRSASSHRPPSPPQTWYDLRHPGHRRRQPYAGCPSIRTYRFPGDLALGGLRHEAGIGTGRPIAVAHSP